MPTRVDDPENTVEDGEVDFGWVLQVTFIVTILAGAPVVAALSTLYTLPDWGARANFAVRMGAVIWFVTASGVYAYARRNA